MLGESASVELLLEPVPVPAPAPLVTPAPMPPEPEKRPRLRNAAIGTAASTLATAAVALGVSLRARTLRDDYDSAAEQYQLTGDLADYQRAQDLADRTDRFNLTADAFWGATIALGLILHRALRFPQEAAEAEAPGSRGLAFASGWFRVVSVLVRSAAMRHSLATLLALLAPLAGGCSWLNAPNDDSIPPDAGVDGGGIELFCDDGLDDDQDLAFDCDDADCAQEPACCALRSPTLSEDWAAANLSGGWIFAPTAEAAWTPLRPSLDGTTFLGGFLPDDSPRALVSRDCVSLALGGWVGTTLRSTDSAGCAADAICERYAGIVLTVANDSAPGSKLQDELAVSLHAGGLVLVTQADVEVARTSVGLDENVEVEIELRPTLDEANLPILKASVTVAGETILADFQVMGFADLLSSGDCAEIPGLRLAAQGRGDEVYLGPVVSAKQNCANPSQFQEQSATLTGSTLEFTPSWVEAYVGSPALASSRKSRSPTSSGT